MNDSWLTDHRVARRIATHRTIEWEMPRRHFLRTSLEAVPALLTNVSVTGLGLTAPEEAHLTYGTFVTVICDGLRGAAIIRRVGSKGESGSRGEAPPAGHRYYALELVNAGPSFVDAILADVEPGSRQVYADSWA